MYKRYDDMTRDKHHYPCLRLLSSVWSGKEGKYDLMTWVKVALRHGRVIDSNFVYNIYNILKLSSLYLQKNQVKRWFF